jgi:hypothetical protein
MEEAVTPESYRKAIGAVVGNDGAPGIDRMQAADLEKHLEDPGEVAGRNLRSHTREANGNQEAERGCQKARNSDGQRELHQSAIRIWDGRRSAIRSIRFAASASRF